jgi:hypothetical protein
MVAKVFKGTHSTGDEEEIALLLPPTLENRLEERHVLKLLLERVRNAILLLALKLLTARRISIDDEDISKDDGL